MMKFSVIKRCKCKSILEVEEFDISIDALIVKDELKYYFSYCCPVCNIRNYLTQKELPRYLIIEKLVKLRASL